MITVHRRLTCNKDSKTRQPDQLHSPPFNFPIWNSFSMCTDDTGLKAKKEKKNITERSNQIAYLLGALFKKKKKHRI